MIFPKCNNFTVKFLEQHLNTIENGLSVVAVIPIIGTITSVAKFALGCVMIVFSMIVYATSVCISILFWNNHEVSEVTEHIKSHAIDFLLHGFGNLLAAIGEGIPLFGTYLVLTRVWAKFYAKDHPSATGFFVVTGHEFKFQPYQNLIAIDAYVLDRSDDDEEHSQAKQELERCTQQAYCYIP